MATSRHPYVPAPENVLADAATPIMFFSVTHLGLPLVRRPEGWSGGHSIVAPTNATLGAAKKAMAEHVAAGDLRR